jgi:hypothetical protein
MRKMCKILVKISEAREQMGNVYIRNGITLNRMLKKWNMKMRSTLEWLRILSSAEFL